MNINENNFVFLGSCGYNEALIILKNTTMRFFFHVKIPWFLEKYSDVNAALSCKFASCNKMATLFSFYSKSFCLHWIFQEIISVWYFVAFFGFWCFSATGFTSFVASSLSLNIKDQRDAASFSYWSWLSWIFIELDWFSAWHFVIVVSDQLCWVFGISAFWIIISASTFFVALRSSIFFLSS